MSTTRPCTHRHPAAAAGLLGLPPQLHRRSGPPGGRRVRLGRHHRARVRHPRGPRRLARRAGHPGDPVPDPRRRDQLHRLDADAHVSGDPLRHRPPGCRWRHPRQIRRSMPGFPTHPDQLTTEWLTLALRHGGAIGPEQHVTAFSTTTAGDVAVGFAGAMPLASSAGSSHSSSALETTPAYNPRDRNAPRVGAASGLAVVSSRMAMAEAALSIVTFRGTTLGTNARRGRGRGRGARWRQGCKSR